MLARAQISEPCQEVPRQLLSRGLIAGSPTVSSKASRVSCRPPKSKRPLSLPPQTRRPRLDFSCVLTTRPPRDVHFHRNLRVQTIRTLITRPSACLSVRWQRSGDTPGYSPGSRPGADRPKWSPHDPIRTGLKSGTAEVADEHALTNADSNHRARLKKIHAELTRSPMQMLVDLGRNLQRRTLKKYVDQSQSDRRLRL
jgi:hypothetical protein